MSDRVREGSRRHVAGSRNSPSLCPVFAIKNPELKCHSETTA